ARGARRSGCREDGRRARIPTDCGGDTMTTLIACSHGTDSPAGRTTIARLVGMVRDRLPGVRVVKAFVDVESPAVADVVAHESGRDDVVVVPLLLSAGFHTA